MRCWHKGVDKSMSGSGYPKFRNDRGVPEICIGVKEFKCIGVPNGPRGQKSSASS
jgi:hypothetical protein